MTLPTDSKVHVFRLPAGADLKRSIQEIAFARKWRAAIVLTCVGSLLEYNLRFANRKEGTTGTGHFEIVSLVGTLSATSAHLHLAIADETGRTTGGHLLEGNRIFTTAEIAIAELPGLAFERVFDPASGYNELSILKR